MSMLAERKRKQKWSLNPRGKDWAEDSNKFGQKMLEKMGWSQGKGLGANENGMTEHVKVPYKNDSKGMGYKESNDQWTEHEENFNSLLENLTGEKPELNLTVLSSLEKKSQTSRARLHYHKFTRGKDLSRYSEKDLANIFGKKSLKESKKPELTEDKASAEAIETKNESSSFIINGGSMADYFKKKLGGFGKNDHGYVIGSNGVLKKDDLESESDMKNVGFGFKSVDNDGENHYGSLEVVKTEEFGVRIKKKPVMSSFVSYVGADNEQNVEKQKYVNDAGEYSAPSNKKRKLEEFVDNKELEHNPKKLKKSKKLKICESEQSQGISNPAFDPMRTPIKLEKHILNPIEESGESFEECSIKSSEKVANNEISSDAGSLCTEKNVKKWKKKSKKKKPSKEINGVENSVFYDNIDSLTNKGGLCEEEIFDIKAKEEPEENEKKLRKKVKKKKCSDNLKNGTENVVLHEVLYSEKSSYPQTEENPYEIKINVGKKKDKRKKKSAEYIEDSLAIVNPNFSLNSSEEISTINEETSNTVGEFEVKRKNEKSKKKKTCSEKEAANNFAIENPVFNSSLEENSESVQEEKLSTFEVKRKLKKDKKKKLPEMEVVNGLDNPALNLNDTGDTAEEHLSCDLILNVTNEETTCEEKSITKVVNERFTITKVNTVKRRKSVRFSDVNEEILIPNNEELKEIEHREEQVINSSEEPVFDIQLNVDASPQVKEITQSSSSEDSNKKKFKKNKRNKYKKGITNDAFDTQTNILEENVESISKTIEKYQAEIENDMNEQKAMEETSADSPNTINTAPKTVEIDDIMVGEVGNPHGENALLPDGSVKLKFKNAKFGRTAWYIDGLAGPRKSYKHLIKGDIILNFKESNLHAIDGYATSLSNVRETAV